MSLDQQLGQILWEAYEDGCRRCEADLWRFVGPLNDWLRALFERRLPVDWRARLGACLDGWEPEGFEVAPDQRQILEDWIHSWAELLGLLPEQPHPPAEWGRINPSSAVPEPSVESRASEPVSVRTLAAGSPSANPRHRTGHG